MLRSLLSTDHHLFFRRRESTASPRPSSPVARQCWWSSANLTATSQSSISRRRGASPFPISAERTRRLWITDLSRRLTTATGTHQPSPARYALRRPSMQHWYRRSNVQHTLSQGQDVNRNHSEQFLAVHLPKLTTPTDVMGPNSWVGEVRGSRGHSGLRRGRQQTVINSRRGSLDVAHKSPAARHKPGQDDIELHPLQITNAEPPDQQSCVTSAGDVRRVTGGTRSSAVSDKLLPSMLRDGYTNTVRVISLPDSKLKR